MIVEPPGADAPGVPPDAPRTEHEHELLPGGTHRVRAVRSSSVPAGPSPAPEAPQVLYEAELAPDGRRTVRWPGLGRELDAWFCVLVGPADAPGAADLVAFRTPHLPAGAIVDVDEASRLGVPASDQAGAMRWDRATGAIDRVHVQPAHRRRGLATALVLTADAVHQLAGWPGSLHADGRRSDQGEAFAAAMEHPERVAPRTVRVPPSDVVRALRRLLVRRGIAAPSARVVPLAAAAGPAGSDRRLEPDASGSADASATWYVRHGSDAPSGRHEVDGWRGPGHPDGAVLDADAARTDGATRLWSLRFDDEGRPIVRFPSLPGVAPVWFCLLAQRPKDPMLVDLVAFDRPVLPPGTVVSDVDFPLLGIASSEQVGAVRWDRSTSIVRLVYVQPEHRRQQLASALVYAASAVHQSHGWVGALRSDGRRTDLGQRFVVALGHPERSGAWRARVAPADPVTPEVAAARRDGAPIWYVRGVAALPSGRSAVRAFRGDAHDDATVLRPDEARVAGAMPLWSVSDDALGRAVVRFDGLPSAPPVVLVVLRGADAPEGSVDLVALPADHPPLADVMPGTVLDSDVPVGTDLGAQLGSVRWRVQDGAILRIGVAEGSSGSGPLLTLLVAAASAWHQANRWSGALALDGRRPARPEQPFLTSFAAAAPGPGPAVRSAPRRRWSFGRRARRTVPSASD